MRSLIGLAVFASFGCPSPPETAEGKTAPTAAAHGEPTATAKPEAKPDAKSDAPVAPGAAVGDPAAKTPTEPDNPAEISEARALVLSGDALVRLAPSGKTETVVAAPDMRSCQVDDDYRVVWLVSTSEIFVWDLEDARLQKVVTGIVGPGDGIVWRVQRPEPPSPFPVATAGNADGLEHCIALVIDMGAAPGVSGEPVAEGDREVYCFEEEDTPDDAAPKLMADEARIEAGYDKARLVDAPLLAALDARRKDKGKRVRAPLVSPPPPAIAIDRARCEEDPESCGTTEYIGGGRLWWVVTDNSRGDFFHETRQLYDSTTRTFWNPATDERKATPLEGGESAELSASPDGTWAVFGDKILSLGDAKATGTLTGSFCGWQ